MLLALLGAGYFVTGNLSAGIDWMWKEPREVLVDRVEEARDSQHAAAEQFRDALTEFKAVVDLPDGDLERQYNKLNAAHKRSQAAAARINKRVDRVVNASNRLLDEWSAELDDYNDPALRRIAEQQFDQTREHATRLIGSMRQIENRMQPVLASFQDQVLYLKHNLNLSAIAALEGEATVIESNVDILIADMNRSIAEADAFIAVILERG
jgi:TPP-dependent trihydroxycyclohexane-1,2-dione (THcHDO) dehydratase